MSDVRASRVGKKGIYLSEYNKDYIRAWLSSTDQTDLYFSLDESRHINLSIAVFKREYPNLKTIQQSPFLIVSKS